MLLSSFYRPDKINTQMAKAFVAYNEAHDASEKTSFRITRKLFQTSKHHENTFLRRNDYFLRRNTGTNFEILSFKAIYFFDCVFNLTVLVSK